MYGFSAGPRNTRSYPGRANKISLDRGYTWSETEIVLATDLPCTDLGYPSTARMSDGYLVTVYYRAGTVGTPNDGYTAHDVSCIAVRYLESELLSAIT